MPELRADDRLLYLDIPSPAELAATARVLSQGAVVAIGHTQAQVDAAREALREFDNVMLIHAELDRIPWRSAFFSLIIVPPHLEPVAGGLAAELHRLLAPGGKLVRSAVSA